MTIDFQLLGTTPLFINLSVVYSVARTRQTNEHAHELHRVFRTGDHFTDGLFNVGLEKSPDLLLLVGLFIN